MKSTTRRQRLPGAFQISSTASLTGDEEFVVERGGQAVCMIVPSGRRPFTVNNLVDLLSAIPKPDLAFWDEVEMIIEHQVNVPEPSW
jgi:hypothetical protein